MKKIKNDTAQDALLQTGTKLGIKFWIIISKKGFKTGFKYIIQFLAKSPHNAKALCKISKLFFFYQN